jgi:hypothetical protein
MPDFIFSMLRAHHTAHREQTQAAYRNKHSCAQTANSRQPNDRPCASRVRSSQLGAHSRCQLYTYTAGHARTRPRQHAPCYRPTGDAYELCCREKQTFHNAVTSALTNNEGLHAKSTCRQEEG